MDVELAPHPTVGADGANHFVGLADRLGTEALLGDELEDGAGGTHPNALSAPGAARVVRIAVAAHDDLGVLAAHPDVQHADFLDVLARAHAAGAEDTGAHVVLDHDVARPLVAGTEREITAGADRDVVLHRVALELVAWIG